MSLELLSRIQQELSISGSAIYETVLGLAERANRKVQVLRLHSQASSLLSQIEQVYGALGCQIAALCSRRPPFSHESTLPSDQLEHVLSQAGDRIQQLKLTLLSVDSHIRELKVALPASVRLVTVLRGPFLVPPDVALVLRVDDVLVMIGLQADLAQVVSAITQVRTAKPA